MLYLKKWDLILPLRPGACKLQTLLIQRPFDPHETGFVDGAFSSDDRVTVNQGKLITVYPQDLTWTVPACAGLQATKLAWLEKAMIGVSINKNRIKWSLWHGTAHSSFSGLRSLSGLTCTWQCIKMKVINQLWPCTLLLPVPASPVGHKSAPARQESLAWSVSVSQNWTWLALKCKTEESSGLGVGLCAVVCA